MNTQSYDPNAGYPNNDDYRNHYELAIFDMVTGQITSLCIAGIEYFDLAPDSYPSAPIWSPDGTQLLFMKYNVQNQSKFDVFILDLNSNIEEKISEDLIPVGWMTKEP